MANPSPCPLSRYRCDRGFTYLGVLVAIAVLGLLLAGTGESWRTAAMREKETELLFAGNQFRVALASYFANSPGGVRQLPERLEDLIEDRRFPVPKRHLRRIYPDPMTGLADWETVRVGGRIVGVHSRATGQPMRTAFSGEDVAFSGAPSYDRWVFAPDLSAAATTGPADR